MKRLVLLVLLAFFLAGCPLTPVHNETTPPNLYFTVWYQNASHDSISDDLGPIQSFDDDVHRCIYVASPFLVRVMATDPGGVASLVVGNVVNQSLAVIDAQTVANPLPGSPVQGDTATGATYPNPGSPFGPGANASNLTYYDDLAQTGGPVYNLATLEVAFQFIPGKATSGQFLVQSINASSIISRIVDYNVMLAGSAANQQPGMPCAVPPPGARAGGTPLPARGSLRNLKSGR